MMLYLFYLYYELIYVACKQSRLASLISENITLLSCLEGNISCSVLSCKCWIKSVSLQCSCVEFYKENLLEYSLLLVYSHVTDLIPNVVLFIIIIPIFRLKSASTTRATTNNHRTGRERRFQARAQSLLLPLR